MRQKLDVTPSMAHVLEYTEILRKMKSSGKKKSTLGVVSANALELLSSMRLLVSRAKIQPLVSVLVDMLHEDHSPLVVFVNFRESASELRLGLQQFNIICELLTGDVTKHKVQSQSFTLARRFYIHDMPRIDK